MKRYIIYIRLNRRRTKLFKKWQLVDEFVTASTKELAAHAAAKRFPNFFVKVSEIVTVAEVDELETLGHLITKDSEEGLELGFKMLRELNVSEI